MTLIPTPSFATYPSLRDTSVIVTGGASGIGMEIVRAFAGQGSRVGFLDFDVENGNALAAELQAGWRAGPVRAVRPARHRRAQARRRRARGGPRPGTGAGEQRRARRPSPLGGRHARVLRRAHRDQPAAHVLRDPGRRAGHDRGRRRFDHQPRIGLVVARRRRVSRLHDRQGRGARPDARHGARPRAAPDPRQHARARLDDDRAAEAAVGDAGVAWRRSSRRSACRIPSSRSTSRGWRCFWRRTIRRCARPTTTWSRRGRSERPAAI